jgi:NAD(P)-dependent dehydrogenase (short-subunit alcohol dehydrogenase family)
MNQRARFADKTVIITGAASGIGRATALQFAAAGARLTLVDTDAAGLAGLAVPARHVVCDVTDEAAARQAVADVLAAEEGIDVLVTAAGISGGRPALDTTLAQFEQIMAVNVTGTFIWIRECLRPMVAAGCGSIVTIASQLARAGGRGNAPYIASKGAVAALTRNIALDYVGAGIRCNAVLPGATDTPLLRRGFARQADPQAAAARSLARHPMGRFGQVEEIAAAVLFLASDEAGFITGVDLPVDGGWLAG